MALPQVYPLKALGYLNSPYRMIITEIDLYVHNVLYVPPAPMGLLCPPQVTQQNGTPGDGLSILTFDSFI